MTRGPRILLTVVGFCWGQALVVFGLAVLFLDPKWTSRAVPSAGLIGAGLFVAMGLVIDPLVPRASPRMVCCLKCAAVFLFYSCTALTLYALLSGHGARVLPM